MLATAIENEVAEYIERHAALRDDEGHRRVVRNGRLPARQIQTGLGLVAVQQPRVHDRRIDEQGQRVGFSSAILPPYLRRTKSLDELIPWLYLRGISTGDFTEALQALLGPQAKGLSATNIVRLKESWQQEWKDWSKQSLAEKVYVYLWADGIYFNIRLEEPDNNRQCILVLMGATAEGLGAASLRSAATKIDERRCSFVYGRVCRRPTVCQEQRHGGIYTATQAGCHRGVEWF